MIYITPPFGTYFRPRHAVPVLGSFTLLSRPGRTMQVLRTLRPVRGGWRNAIGLRNGGVTPLTYRPGGVYSLAGVNDGDWERLYHAMAVKQWPEYLIELNLSCPNIDEYHHPSREV